MTGNTNKPNWQKRLIAEMKRDKKKTGILAVLFLVALIVGGRLILKQATPAKASASAVQNQAASNSATQEGSAAGDSEVFDTQLQQRHDAAKKEYLPPASINISRDLFIPNDEYFPIAQPVQSASKVTSQAATQPGEDRKKAIRLEVLAQARALSLQCTIDGPQPAAIINQSMVRQGGWINGFKVVQITTRECTLEKKGVTVVLSMRDANGQ